MSDEPPSEPERGQAGREGSAENMGEGPDAAGGPNQGGAPAEGVGAGAILLGIFLILFGLCLTLVGGGCTALWIYIIFTEGTMDAGALTLLSVAVLAAGLGALWVGIKLLRGGYRR